MTTLHLAAENGRIEMVNCLLDQGADINIQDDNSVSLLADYFELVAGAVSIVHFLSCLK